MFGLLLGVLGGLSDARSKLPLPMLVGSLDGWAIQELLLNSVHYFQRLVRRISQDLGRFLAILVNFFFFLKIFSALRFALGGVRKLLIYGTNPCYNSHEIIENT